MEQAPQAPDSNPKPFIGIVVYPSTFELIIVYQLDFGRVPYHPL